MDDVETRLQQFGEYLLRGRLVQERAAPFCVRWVRRLRTRHYARRTEHSYADWVRRFFSYASERQGDGPPRVDADVVRDFLTYLAVRRRVAASTQNQALCAVLFLCHEVLAVDVDGLGDTVRARSGSRLLVLSVPEVGSLLGAMKGTSWLQAALIYGGGLKVSGPTG